MSTGSDAVNPQDTVRVHSGPHAGKTGTVVSVDRHGSEAAPHATVWVRFEDATIDGFSLRNVEKVKGPSEGGQPDAGPLQINRALPPPEGPGEEGVSHRIEVFSAGCPLCTDVVARVYQIAGPSCEVEVLDMHEDRAVELARQYRIRQVPAVVIDGRLAEIVDAVSDKGGPEEVTRKVIGWEELGRPTEPGTYVVRGVGRVVVTQVDIDEARQLQNPQVALTEELAPGADVKQYAIMYFQEGGKK